MCQGSELDGSVDKIRAGGHMEAVSDNHCGEGRRISWHVSILFSHMITRPGK